MREYDHKKIEEKWRKKWREEGLYKTDQKRGGRKSYVLGEFPYPSGEGLHAGHTRIYTASDVYARKKRMEGYSVLFPMGWDAFGLPAEQHAIKNKVHPSVSVKKNTERFKAQMDALAFSYDWDREINTTDPAYYKWTQWIFLRLYERGLAYQSYEAINWCPSCQTGLANEDLEGGKCERCGTDVIKKSMRQWVLRITDYAERLLADIDGLHWHESIKDSQRNWIGRSEGAEIDFPLVNEERIPIPEKNVTVFTTRADTLYGATFLAISAELAKKWIDAGWRASENVKRFVDKTLAEETKRGYGEIPDKDGLATGMYAINPANGTKIPLWIANYVLSGYGTGAIMAVPAHDDRDYDFAQKYEIPIIEVVSPPDGEKRRGDRYTADGVLVNSGVFDGKTSGEARRLIAEKVRGRFVREYKLRDWVFSRQRYWGEPIPVVHDPDESPRRQKALIIHGIDADREWAWIPWLSRELEERGFEVIAPSMPDAKHPDHAKWLAEIEKTLRDFGRHDVIVAHSLGTKAAVDAVLKSGVPFGHLFLIATSLGEIEERDWKKFEVEFRDKVDVAAVRKFWTTKTDLYSVKHFASGVTVINSDDDHLLNEAGRGTIPDNWIYVRLSGKGHFRGKEQTEIRDLVIRQKREYGIYPVDPGDLPVILPDVESYAPTGTGESPLADIKNWVEVEGYITNEGTFKCGAQEDAPADKKTKTYYRETNTMPQWAGSSWYYLRYIDPANDRAIIDPEKEQYRMPVDVYVGGAEHVTRHLIYARFWHKFLYDIGVVSTPEPFMMRQTVGLVLGEGGVKMSKRLGNVINPDQMIERFGADALRIYELFMGPFGQAIAWSTDNLVGARRFIERLWKIIDATTDASSTTGAAVPHECTMLLHQTIKKVGEDIEGFKFNTAISQLMILVNTLEKNAPALSAYTETLVRLIAPFAPHIAEELWSILGNTGSVHTAPWPEYDPAKLTMETIRVVIQVNGKVRDTMEFTRNTEEEEIVTAVLQNKKTAKWLEGKTPKKTVYVANKLLNIVV